jgi:hypothetical protein
MGSSKLDFVDVILKSYEALLTALPRFQSYTAVLPNSPTLQLAIEEFFDAYVSLSLRCIKAFGRGKFSNDNRVIGMINTNIQQTF